MPFRGADPSIAPLMYSRGLTERPEAEYDGIIYDYDDAETDPERLPDVMEEEEGEISTVN